MTYTLVNRATSDAVTPAATLACPGASTVTLTIANAAVMLQLGHGDSAGNIWDWEPEEFLIPGVHVFDERVDAVRARSATPGKPAQLSVAAR